MILCFFQQPSGPSQYSRDYFSSQQQDSPAGFSSSASLLADQVLSSRQNDDEYGGRYQTRRPPEPDYGESRYGSGGGRGYRRSPSPPMQRDRYLPAEYEESIVQNDACSCGINSWTLDTPKDRCCSCRFSWIYFLMISGGEGATTRTSTP